MFLLPAKKGMSGGVLGVATETVKPEVARI